MNPEKLHEHSALIMQLQGNDGYVIINPPHSLQLLFRFFLK